MKNVILAVVGTILLIAVGFFAFGSGDAEPVSTEPVVETPYQPPAVTDEQRLAWSRQAYEQLTSEHRLHLSAEEQQVFQACLLQQFRAAHAYEVTQAEEAKVELRRWQAEVDRWEAQAHAAAQTEAALP